MTDAEFEYELVEALNMLLEDERASVEMEVALASGATEYSERDALSTMGADDIRYCELIRAEMEQAGLQVTPQINGVVFQVIGAERYDDRLRAFAHHQRVVAERAKELQESNLEGALREALEGISLTHVRHADWTEDRANAFAATRTLEFGPTGRITAGRSAGASAAEDAALAEDLAAQADAALTQRPEQARDTGDMGDETQSDVAESDAALANLVAEGGEQDEVEDTADSVSPQDELPSATVDDAPTTPAAKASAQPRARSASTTTRKPATPRASARTTRTTRASSDATSSATRRTRRPSTDETDATSETNADA